MSPQNKFCQFLLPSGKMQRETNNDLNDSRDV